MTGGASKLHHACGMAIEMLHHLAGIMGRRGSVSPSRSSAELIVQLPQTTRGPLGVLQELVSVVGLSVSFTHPSTITLERA